MRLEDKSFPQGVPPASQTPLPCRQLRREVLLSKQIFSSTYPVPSSSSFNSSPVVPPLIPSHFLKSQDKDAVPSSRTSRKQQYDQQTERVLGVAEDGRAVLDKSNARRNTSRNDVDGMAFAQAIPKSYTNRSSALKENNMSVSQQQRRGAHASLTPPGSTRGGRTTPPPAVATSATNTAHGLKRSLKPLVGSPRTPLPSVRQTRGAVHPVATTNADMNTSARNFMDVVNGNTVAMPQQQQQKRLQLLPGTVATRRISGKRTQRAEPTSAQHDEDGSRQRTPLHTRSPRSRSVVVSSSSSPPEKMIAPQLRRDSVAPATMTDSTLTCSDVTQPNDICSGITVTTVACTLVETKAHEDGSILSELSSGSLLGGNEGNDRSCGSYMMQCAAPSAVVATARPIQSSLSSPPPRQRPNTHSTGCGNVRPINGSLATVRTSRASVEVPHPPPPVVIAEPRALPSSRSKVPASAKGSGSAKQEGKKNASRTEVDSVRTPQRQRTGVSFCSNASIMVYSSAGRSGGGSRPMQQSPNGNLTSGPSPVGSGGGGGHAPATVAPTLTADAARKLKERRRRELYAWNAMLAAQQDLVPADAV